MIEYWCYKCKKYTPGRIESEYKNYNYIECPICNETIARKPKEMK